MSTTETLHIRMMIGDKAYTVDEVIETTDTMTALRVGQGISLAILNHGSLASEVRDA